VQMYYGAPFGVITGMAETRARCGQVCGQFGSSCSANSGAQHWRLACKGRGMLDLARLVFRLAQPNCHPCAALSASFESPAAGLEVTCEPAVTAHRIVGPRRGARNKHFDTSRQCLTLESRYITRDNPEACVGPRIAVRWRRRNVPVERCTCEGLLKIFFRGNSEPA